jgi:hypothetical protein
MADRERLADCAAAAAVAMALVLLPLKWLKPGYSIMIAGTVVSAGILSVSRRIPGVRRSVPALLFYLAAGILAVFTVCAALSARNGFLGRLAYDFLQGGARVPWNFLIPVLCLAVLLPVIRSAALSGLGNSFYGRLALAAAVSGLAPFFFLRFMNDRLDPRMLMYSGLFVCAAAIFLNRARPAILSALVLISFFVIFISEGQTTATITMERTFFGLLRTREIDDPVEQATTHLRVLTHGNTLHGAQLLGPGLSRQPLTYYNPRTALGEAILAALSIGDPSRVAVIGLGAGTTACLIRPTDRLTIFEIDPAVIRLAAEPGGDFTYVRECQPGARIVTGDARLRMAAEPDGSFDLIIVDAFSSDAVPAHLLTREALALYLRKTSGRGVVILHLSSRNLALADEAARLVRDLDVPAVYRASQSFLHPYAAQYGGMPASVMITAKSMRIFSMLPLKEMPGWRMVKPPSGAAWSDDHINIPRALWESLSGEQERITSSWPAVKP